MSSPTPADHAPSGERNEFIGWSCMAIGVLVGLVMGLWSFDGPVSVPTWLGEYGDPSRRLARLGHIAFIGLGILNVLLARHTRVSSADWSFHRAALLLMNFGNLLLPIALLGAAVWRPIKYVMPFPALAVGLALCLTAWTARPRSTRQGGGDATGAFR